MAYLDSSLMYSIDMKSLGFYYSAHQGAIAQLGERFAGSEEVIGSIPFSSTKFKTSLLRFV